MMKQNGWEFYVTEGKHRVGLVLVHEIFGLNDYARSVADQLSQNGYFVAAIDVFRGAKPSSLEEGRKIRKSLSKEEALDGLRNGQKLLREKMPGGSKVGTMGFCMGGGFALLGASNLDFDFCIDYYGIIQRVEEAAGRRGPVQLILGSEDERVNTWAFQTFLPAAVKFKKRIDMHLYPNARHAFHRPNWEGYNPVAAEDAWSKTLLFLAQFK